MTGLVRTVPCKRGNKLYLMMNTPGYLLAARVTAGNAQNRAQVEQLVAKVQHVAGASVELGYADQSLAGVQPTEAALTRSMQLGVVKLPEARRSFVLPSRRLVLSAVLCHRSFGWLTCFCRLARDDERPRRWPGCTS